MSKPIKLSENARSDARIQSYIAELTRRSKQLDFIRTELCKLASACCTERIKNLKLPNYDQIYCEDLNVLWVAASDCCNLCDNAVSRLELALRQEDPDDES